MTKVVNFFLDVYGEKGNKIQALRLFEEMSPSDIETSLRKAAFANANDNVLLYSPPEEPEQKPIIMPFFYKHLSDKVEYRLVVTAKQAGKI